MAYDTFHYVSARFGTLNPSNPENGIDFRRVTSGLATLLPEDEGEEAKYFGEGSNKPMGNAH